MTKIRLHEKFTNENNLPAKYPDLWYLISYYMPLISLHTCTHTHRPFRGLVEDSLRCYSLYRSDILDAFSIQGLASLILIYFANITLAFTFGAFLSDITQGSLVSQIKNINL